MKITIFGVSGLILLASVAVFTQLPPPPVPSVETEVRDANSGRMRELQLERFRRDANKLRPTETSAEAEMRFARIKEDFEGIQKLQSGIVKTYTTGRTVDFDRIQRFAAEMNKRAVRLGSNYFGWDADEFRDGRPQPTSKKSVRDLIIELDKRLGEFVGSPLFRDHVVVDAAENTKAESTLKRVVALSAALNIAAAKQSRPSN